MEEENPLESAGSSEETLQKNADMMRLLKAGLRNHDSETIEAAMIRISNTYGVEIAKNVVFITINMLMNTENWSFEMENGEPSPLI